MTRISWDDAKPFAVVEVSLSFDTKGLASVTIAVEELVRVRWNDTRWEWQAQDDSWHWATDSCPDKTAQSHTG